ALARSAGATLDRLAAACIVPLEPCLQHATRVFIRPAAGLEAVPWGALSFGDGPLWERAAVCLVAGARGFAEGDGARATRGMSGAAQLWAARSDDLPGVDAEVHGIRKVYSGARIHSGDHATRAAFLKHAGEATLLHFAGHGTFRADNPLFSSLQFTDGDLLFLDLERVRLCADLVVLSACRTGQSRPELGIGAGLTRGFLQAGARSLMSSLWRIGDRETSEFMTAFYRDLRKTGVVEQALRRTALRLRQEGAHVADWAAFQLVLRSL
ncbi:MAG: CHAT domain-containing protein, partial [Gemmatimonadetes bacterium]|nr:CHAT domain-containing protein [Gemmatimonadota bacterium]